MGTLLSVIEGMVGIVGSFIGAMNSTQLSSFMSVVGRWVARIDLFLWPDVRDPPAPRRLRNEVEVAPLDSLSRPARSSRNATARLEP